MVQTGLTFAFASGPRAMTASSRSTQTIFILGKQLQFVAGMNNHDMATPYLHVLRFIGIHMVFVAIGPTAALGDQGEGAREAAEQQLVDLHNILTS